MDALLSIPVPGGLSQDDPECIGKREGPDVGQAPKRIYAQRLFTHSVSIRTPTPVPPPI